MAPSMIPRHPSGRDQGKVTTRIHAQIRDADKVLNPVLSIPDPNLLLVCLVLQVVVITLPHYIG